LRAVIALGNPGAGYEFTRHNYGWLVADELEDRLRITGREKTASYHLVRAAHAGAELLICRPQTFMNHSGIAVDNLLRAHHLELEDLLVLHDDLDIPFGRIRLKDGGGHSGHKGLISIIRELGGTDFLRLRLGIGCDPRPADSVAYVLQPFDESEIDTLGKTIKRAAEATIDLLHNPPALVMNRVNRRQRQVPGESDPDGEEKT